MPHPNYTEKPRRRLEDRGRIIYNTTGGAGYVPSLNVSSNRNTQSMPSSKYDTWVNALAKKWGISKKELEQDDYDYKGFYNSNPKAANAILIDKTGAHFPDTYKLPTHPTFSDESLYSGRNGNIVGGTWRNNPSALQRWTYQLSPDQIRNNWNVRRTLEYAGDAEDEGFRVTDIYGRLPILDNILQGGILPAVTVRPKRKEGGIYIKPSKRGTFTAAATKHGMGIQEFASRVLRNKEDYSPSLVKKANFARNASKWH